jgi:hypothetical protein
MFGWRIKQMPVKALWVHNSIFISP